MNTLFECVHIKIYEKVICLYSGRPLFRLYRAVINCKKKKKKIQVSCLKLCRPMSWLTAGFFPPLLKQICWHPVYVSWDEYSKYTLMSHPACSNPFWPWFLPHHLCAHQRRPATGAMELWYLGKVKERFCRTLPCSHEQTKNGWAASNVSRGKNKF